MDQELMHYAEQHSSPESGVLHRIHRETWIRMPFPRMLSGHLQGRLLSMLSCLMQPATILEVGTFTAYSAICLAEGLREGGVLHTIESNVELESTILTNIADAGLQDRVKLHLGNALEVIPGFDELFDLMFLDADKENYPEYYALLMPKLRQGGLLIADNTLWGGKILHKAHSGDAETRAIQDFNDTIASDPGVEKLLLPFRDGMTLIRKL